MQELKHHFSSGLYAREMHVSDGYSVVTHEHTYDHLSVLAKGIALVTVDGIQSTYYAPCVIEIKANKAHGIVAVGDVVWLCIHATSETDANKMDEVLISGNG